MVQVEDWNRKGYKVDLTSNKARQAYKVAVERAFQANKDHKEGTEFAVPSQFFEMTLIQGLAPGGDKNFKDLDGKYLSSNANADMVEAVDSIINAGLKEVRARGKGGTVTLDSVMTQIKKGWSALKPDEQKAYNEGAGDGYSGFSKYIIEQSKTLK